MEIPRGPFYANSVTIMMGGISIRFNAYSPIKHTMGLCVALLLPLILGCSFPANIKEASKRQMELLNQADQTALNYEKTFGAVIDVAIARYLDSQAKAVALKDSERLMVERRPVGALSEEVRQAMEKVKRTEELLRNVQLLENMKARNTRNFKDYRRYLEVTKTVGSLLNAFISTDAAPDDKDLDALEKAVKGLAK